jgi:hypothetical protein
VFVCDDASSEAGPRFLSEDGDCGYFFEWHTPLACPPKTSVNCSVAVNGRTYDFAPLGLSDVSVVLPVLLKPDF